MTTVLVTGFEPFGGSSTNASWEAVSALPPMIADARVHARLLPCVFGRSARRLTREFMSLRPDLVICVGEAGGRSEVSIERVAVNLDDARIPDNDGNRPIDVPIDAAGPNAHFARLPVKACVAAARDADVPASVSLTAGSYVCNHVFYHLMRRLESAPDVLGGFIHVPLSDALAPAESARALEAVIGETLRRGLTDLVAIGGTEY